METAQFRVVKLLVISYGPWARALAGIIPFTHEFTARG